MPGGSPNQRRFFRRDLRTARDRGIILPPSMPIYSQWVVALRTAIFLDHFHSRHSTTVPLVGLGHFEGGHRREDGENAPQLLTELPVAHANCSSPLAPAQQSGDRHNPCTQIAHSVVVLQSSTDR